MLKRRIKTKVREYEKQTDDMVYKLYGLPPSLKTMRWAGTPGEIEIVEKSRGEKLD